MLSCYCGWLVLLLVTCHWTTRKVLLSREGRELQVNPRRSEGLSVFGAKDGFVENRVVGLRKGCWVEEELLSLENAEMYRPLVEESRRPPWAERRDVVVLNVVLNCTSRWRTTDGETGDIFIEPEGRPSWIVTTGYENGREPWGELKQAWMRFFPSGVTRAGIWQ